MDTFLQEKKISAASWQKQLIRQEEIDCYLENGEDFIDEEVLEEEILTNREPSADRVRAIIAKAFDVELMDRADVAALANVEDPALRREVFAAAVEIKKKVYDNRVVTFAPLYCGSKCVNRCKYCGFRAENNSIERRVLSMDEIEEETRILAGKIGHKRLVVVFGEHPETDADYIASCMKRIYSVREKVRKGVGEIRRVNINAAPMPLEDLKKLREAGIGTYQVFQETYHRKTYEEVHPRGTLKGDYRWRLYALHRSMDAGIDDVAIGALFGLYDWRFEVLGLVEHARALEKRYGLGPHTVSVPRLEPAADTDFSWVKHVVSDDDFRYLVTILRLAVPYAGLILTNRESPEMLKSLQDVITQRDADSRLGIGAYAEAFAAVDQAEEKQQFMLGDTRSLDEIVRELADGGHIVSFCTAGYRCGRTGEKIMKMLKSGQEGGFCKLNAVLTFQEWLDDFATPETRRIGTALIEREIEEIKQRTPGDFSERLVVKFLESHKRILAGERDLYF